MLQPWTRLCIVRKLPKSCKYRDWLRRVLNEGVTAMFVLSILIIDTTLFRPERKELPSLYHSMSQHYFLPYQLLFVSFRQMFLTVH